MALEDLIKMETKYSAETIEKELGKKYRAFEGAPRSFYAPDGTIFRVSNITKLKSWVLEYAESEELARKGLFGEDGDLFPMELSLGEVTARMIEEISE